MNVNLTLFAQMANFFISYWMLSRGILKPVLALLQKELAHKKQLKGHVESERQVVEIKQKDKLERLEEAKVYFKENMPKLEIQMVKIEATEVTPVQIGAEKLNKIVDTVVNELKSRITNG